MGCGCCVLAMCGGMDSGISGEIGVYGRAGVICADTIAVK